MIQSVIRQQLLPKKLQGLRSSTIWTSAYDLHEKILYYHTQHNRRVRMLRLSDVDLQKNNGTIIHLPLDREKTQDYDEIILGE